MYAWSGNILEIMIFLGFCTKGSHFPPLHHCTIAPLGAMVWCPF